MLEGSDLTRWRREMVMFLALRGQAGSWEYGRTATGLPDLTQEVGESADAKAMRRKGASDAVSAASAMMQSIPASRRSNLALTDADRYNPDKVWDAVTTLCLGSVADAQGEDIEPSIQVGLPQLLWRHVGQLAFEHPRLGLLRVRPGLGDPKIQAAFDIA